MQTTDDGDETSSVLEAESRFLPLQSELSASPLKPFSLEYLMSPRPKTAPSSNEVPVDKSPELNGQRGDNRTALCSAADPCKDPSLPSDAKYEHLEDKFSNKPAVSVTRRIAANFGQVPGHGIMHHSGLMQPKVIVSSAPGHPAVSGTSLSVQDKFTSSPGSHGHPEPLEDLTELDGLSTDSSQASLELKLLKALMDKRNSEKKHKKSASRKSRDQGLQRPGDSSVTTSRSSLSELPHKTQYTPEKYKSPSRRSRGSLHPEAASVEAESTKGHAGSCASSSRITETRLLEELARMSKDDKQNGDDVKEKTSAATKIQALWRGFLVRHKEGHVTRALREIRTRRSEEHIRHLLSEVERQRNLYEREKRLRSVQVEAMKFLWKEVQELQKWKNSVLLSQEHCHLPPVSFAPSCIHDSQITMDNIPRIIETLEIGSDQTAATHSPVLQNINFPMPSTSSPNPTKVLPHGVHMMDVASSQVRASQKEIELENVCKGLQKQVSHLQEVLTSMSQVVFPRASQQSDMPLTDTQNTGTQSLGASQTITLTTEDITLMDTTETTNPVNQEGVCLSTATRHQPPSRPSAPSELTAQRSGATTVHLQWQPSVVLNMQGIQASGVLLGYRVFVNDEAKGMTHANQTKVTLEGLLQTSVYRIFVCAVSVVGDSPKSNVVIMGPETDSGQQRFGSSNSDHHDDDGNVNDDAGNGHPGGIHPGGVKGRERQPSGGSANSQPPPSNSGASAPDGSTAPTSSQGKQPGQNSDSHNNRNTATKQRFDQSPEGRSTSARDSSTPKSSKHHKSHEPSAACEDSGYLTSPGCNHVFSHVDKLSKASGTLANSIQDEVVRASLLQKIETAVLKDMIGGSFVVGSAGMESHDDLKGGIGSSPRISEGLTKKFEGSKEIKQAVKSQKRKPSPDHGVPLKAIPSDSDLREKEGSHRLPSGEDSDDVKNKALSKIPVYTGRSGTEDNKLQRKSSWTDSSSEGSKSRKNSLTDSRSRRSSGNDSTKSRKHSSSEQEADGSISPSKSITAHIKNQESLRQLLDDATAKIRASQEKNLFIAVKGKSNTFGAESSSSSLIAKDQTPQSHTWPKEKSDRCPVTTVDTDDEHVLSVDGQLLKSPDVVGMQRKNSLKKKLSLRSRHCSGSDSSDGSEHQKKEPKTKSRRHHSRNSSSSRKSSGSEPECANVDAASSPEQTSMQYFVRDSRGRKSHREPKRPKEVTTEKRASSVGPVPHDITQVGQGVIIDKPPLARPPHTRLPDTPTSGRQRSKSEQGTSSSGEVDVIQNSTEQSMNKNKASPRDKKKSPSLKISHRRCASDAAVVPCLNLSDIDSSKDKKMPPPSTPKQCPSSPRVRRSSSFSKSHSGETASEGVALLRQCISLETLKAAKSADAQERLVARQKQKQAANKAAELSPSGDDQKMKEVLSVQEPVLSGASRDSTPPGSKFHRSNSLREMRSKKKDPSTAADGVQPCSTEVNSEQTAKPDKYSPKLNCGKKDNSSKHGKIKLGGNAANLFAKLQMKVSNNKS